MKKKISVGIIGFGRMGQNHAKSNRQNKIMYIKIYFRKKYKILIKKFMMLNFYNKEKEFFKNKIDLF